MDSTSYPPTLFGTTLRHLRETQKMGLRELARRSGVSPSLLSRIENGVRTAPPLESVLRLITALGLQQNTFEVQNLLACWRDVRDPYGEREADFADEWDTIERLLQGVPMPPKVTPVEPCETIAKLAAELSHTLFERSGEIASVTVQFADGTTKRFQITKEKTDKSI